MKEYVVGFAFRKAKNEVLLLLKAHPSWQAGRFNGVGGHVEIGKENEVEAMKREFLEEVGISVPIDKWIHFCTVYGNRAAWKLTCFWTDYFKCSDARRMEDEEPMWINIDKISDLDIINNLTWLIPMARAKHNIIAAVTNTI